ncbi:MAG: diguanylate cyclase domain-containing protein [Pseudomonadota bacterium]
MNRDARPLILLVDDVPANLHVLAAALKDDYRLKTATRGERGLSLARAVDDPPALILLDVMMPGMGGIDMLRALRQSPATADIPVIFVSADASEQSQLDGLELGADDYLAKPVIRSVLRARVRNLIQRRQAEAQLRLAAHVFEHSGEGILIADADNHIVDVNPAFTRLTGYSAEEVRGRNPRILASGETRPDLYRELWHALQTTGHWQGELWNRHKTGRVFPKLVSISTVRGRAGAIEYFIANYADISEQKATEARIRHQAHHDPLTGLDNRLSLTLRLEQHLVEAHPEGEEMALMFIDLDRFKAINDSLGHLVGDKLLVAVAGRLRECVRESDLIARQGGDEFVVALFGPGTARAAPAVAGKIIARLGEPYDIDGQPVVTSASIGISLYPRDGDSATDLMRRADTAMYRAKSAGRNQYRFHEPGNEPD